MNLVAWCLLTPSLGPVGGLEASTDQQAKLVEITEGSKPPQQRRLAKMIYANNTPATVNDKNDKFKCEI